MGTSEYFLAIRKLLRQYTREAKIGSCFGDRSYNEGYDTMLNRAIEDISAILEEAAGV